MSSARGRLLVACALGLPAMGCVVESNDPGPPPPVPVAAAPSQLTVHWTVDEGSDPNVCAMGGSAAIDIVVTTAAGASGGEYQAACESFATTISTLPPGDYQATATLIDGSGAERTTPISMQPFTLLSGSNLVVDLDFPASSFH